MGHTCTMATRYECSNRNTKGSGMLHTHGDGKPKRKVCDYCGSRFDFSNGIYAVVPWRADGMYSLDQAVKTYQTRKAAEKYAGDTYSVRWIEQ